MQTTLAKIVTTITNYQSSKETIIKKWSVLMAKKTQAMLVVLSAKQTLHS